MLALICRWDRRDNSDKTWKHGHREHFQSLLLQRRRGSLEAEVDQNPKNGLLMRTEYVRK